MVLVKLKFRLKELLVCSFFVLVFVLYLPFINSPLVFDDLYFFSPGGPESFLNSGFSLKSRWLPLMTHAMTFVYIGDEVAWQRLGNMILHAANGVILFYFINQLLGVFFRDKFSNSQVVFSSFVGSLLFVFHPASVYAVAYLIQRTTLMATFFSMLSWLLFWNGLSGRRVLIALSFISYALAVMSKEHAVMAFSVFLPLYILHRGEWGGKGRAREVVFLLIGGACIALLVALKVSYVIGNAYEPSAQRVLDGDSFYLRSFVTQAGLFFKYLLIWIVPNGGWMSVDMREPFEMAPISLLGWVWVGVFLLYPIVAGRLLFLGGVFGLVGFSLLVPWLLFLTEVATIRVQEIFVVYRSYLWVPPLFLVFSVGFLYLKNRIRLVLAVALFFVLAIGSVNKLMSFSSPFFLWDEAADLARGKESDRRFSGVERIYHNRGLSLAEMGMYRQAEEDLTRAISIYPGYANALSDRGGVYLELGRGGLALKDFDAALALDSKITKAHLGRGLALELIGDVEAAKIAHKRACGLGWERSCLRINSIP